MCRLLRLRRGLLRRLWTTLLGYCWSQSQANCRNQMHFVSVVTLVLGPVAIKKDWAQSWCFGKPQSRSLWKSWNSGSQKSRKPKPCPCAGPCGPNCFSQTQPGGFVDKPHKKGMYFFCGECAGPCGPNWSNRWSSMILSDSTRGLCGQNHIKRNRVPVFLN